MTADNPTEAPLFDRLSVPVAAMALPARAINLFKSLNISYAGEVAQQDPSTLMRNWSFGKTSLRAVELALERLGLQFGMTVGSWTREHAEDLDARHARQVAALTAPTIPEPRDLAEALRAVLASVEPRRRNVDIIAQYLGWDGQGGSTLERSGAPYGLTRERVRQLVARALRKLQHRAAPHVLIDALAAIEAKIPLSRSRATDALQIEGFTAAPFDPIGLIEAASAFRLQIGWQIPELADRSFLVHRGGDKALKRAAKAARRLSSSRGCVDLYQLPFEAELSAPYDALPLLQDFFDTQSDFDWLDREAGWLWRMPGAVGARNRLVNNLRKLLAASPAISLHEFRIGLRRNPRMCGFAPPLAILREICARVSFATLDGDCVKRVEDAAAWDEVLGTSESTIVEVLRQNGPVLSRIPFLNACLARGMLEGTFAMFTSTSPLLWQPAGGMFALLGTEIPPGLVEEQQRVRPPIQREALADGWTGDGILYVAWRLSERRAASGTLYVPVSVQRLVQGEWRVRSNPSDHYEPTPMIVEADQLIGLKSAFRRAGAEAGDVAVLWFDRSARLATVAIGTRELADEAAAGIPSSPPTDSDGDDDED